ncbi:acyl-CoA thioesterase/bile acid-CoA:amino acid N-acyltransferase family protein [Haloarchaeobius baliensis]|uniref:acyl-CoA thioesterase/bile acid-CoA:amino acid N-acyltransferase family protein n=1 Tax=Haloarchaeobius baliensis TaxID=1670458 RepID=UPI003F882E20
MADDSDGATLSVSPDRPRLDTVPRIRANGLTAGEQVTLRTTTSWGDATYTATATFIADADGTVDTAEMAPESGDYDGVDPAGLLWGATLTEGRPSRETPATAPTAVTLEREGEQLADATVERVVKPDGVTRQDATTDIPADLYLPGDEESAETVDPAPGIVVLGGSEGGRPRSPLPWLLADEGYAVLAPAYMGEDGAPADELSEVPVAAVADAVRRFADHDATSGRLAVLGKSRGSELAGLLATRVDAIELYVGVAPSGIAFEGLDSRNQTTGTSAWAIDGEPTPFVPIDEDAITADPIEIADSYVGGIDATDDGRVANAELLDGFDGTVLLVAGEDDRMWRSARLAGRLADRLDDGPASVRLETYPDAGHAISPPVTHTTGRALVPAGPEHQLALGGTAEGYARADREHWDVVLETLAVLRE